MCEECLRKCVTKETIFQTLVMRAEKTKEEIADTCIFIKSERRYFKVFLRDILFVEGLRDYIIIQTTLKRFITKMTLKAIQELLPAKNFFRINRSYIVNLQHIDSFNKNDIFIDHYEIGIGSRYKEEFYKLYISEHFI